METGNAIDTRAKQFERFTRIAEALRSRGIKLYTIDNQETLRIAEWIGKGWTPSMIADRIEHNRANHPHNPSS